MPLPEDRVAVPGGGVELQPWSAPEVRAGKGSLGLQLYTSRTGKRSFGTDETEMAPRSASRRVALARSRRPSRLAAPHV